jgi:hypothetical protein
MSTLLADLIAGAQHQAALHEGKAAALLAPQPDTDALGHPTMRDPNQRERAEAAIEQERARQLRAWAAHAPATSGPQA